MPYRPTACTIAGNQTGTGGTGPRGNGLAGNGGGLSGGTAILQHCLIAQNTGGGSAPDVNVLSLTTVGTNLLGTAPSFFGTNPGPASGVTPAGDFDGDGQSNEQETIAGTILTDPNSVFRVTTVVRSSGNLVISFPSVTGKTYTLWRSDNLTGAFTNTGLTAITGNGSVRQFTVSPAPVAGVPKRFFRVQVGP